MSNNNRGSRAALAAMVVAVMAMSAVSAEAAVNRAPAKKSGATVQVLKRAVASLLVRYWEPFGELPSIYIPRAGNTIK